MNELQLIKKHQDLTQRIKELNTQRWQQGAGIKGNRDQQLAIAGKKLHQLEDQLQSIPDKPISKLKYRALEHALIHLATGLTKEVSEIPLAVQQGLCFPDFIQKKITSEILLAFNSNMRAFYSPRFV